MNKDILICGVGGQGTVLASKIIAAAAMNAGNTVHSAETIGMAQRGGPVTSHVRVGDDKYSPLIPQGAADVLIAFEPAEAVRNLAFLRKDGVVITNTSPVMPVTEALMESGYDGKDHREFLSGNVRCVMVDGEKLCNELGSMKFLNIVLLGAAVATGELDLDANIIISEIEKRVPEKFIEINKKAFDMGLNIR